MDERVRQIVIDLAKALIRKAQEKQLNRRPLHALQLVDCVEFHHRGV